jgi:hypothetical protein
MVPVGVQTTGLKRDFEFPSAYGHGSGAQIAGPQPPKSNNLIFEVSLICPMA